jgi:predicted aspartyl protease
MTANPKTLLLKQYQPQILYPELDLDLMLDGAFKSISKTCLIDTGCDLPLVIDSQTYVALGEPEFVRPDNAINVAGNIEVEAASIHLDVHFAGQIIPVEALILETETRPIIGTPLLKAMCQLSDTIFAIDFLRSLVYFEK